jgi:hypothetical protein
MVACVVLTVPATAIAKENTGCCAELAWCPCPRPSRAKFTSTSGYLAPHLENHFNDFATTSRTSDAFCLDTNDRHTAAHILPVDPCLLDAESSSPKQTQPSYNRSTPHHRQHRDRRLSRQYLMSKMRIEPSIHGVRSSRNSRIHAKVMSGRPQPFLR